MQPDLEVDTEELRHDASAVAGTASRIIVGAAQAPSPDTTPRWVTADAAMLAALAARQQLGLIGAEVADTARRITTAAADYELADARAVTRLRLSR
ncbi:hypothetical protein [Paractinoplanes atraurantiacus]|uniref:Excreted virulence factor EspC, type VII ESX diderm n=1 Tax=Paractinoplanes atraurantiacus TaxID=1036182 RepID=A0A285IV71_9ACTN|nr:hypothetical protein [Actinoplanes atraurantiacus]SNY51868.1 hypothetical protein SAMN05421748_112125 [Actinoplanes atraurantiacus]